ncbi:hypothetical protein H696_02194 [Fonticula alba]|uniref:ATP synthase subunit delta, mitochondrial n=1 Tax=Fonticula alba TaxID=691883 RepID=A0A058ZAA1_FONAL|nr:hypothetical protein H696_02194 [Fonticula alba]KCV71244.1 hypothetical protein H696_02194 [Fonticula alba]|eukprot:XP_009494367.1 hypothetical protein H696_02194 [Fonticula alba]
MLSRTAFSAVRPALARAYSSTAAAATPNGLRLLFSAPHEAFYNNVEVSQVNIPAVSGVMGILANHVPYITELRPGTVEVIALDKSVTKYFVSGGFAVMNHDSSLNVTAVEAVNFDDIDIDLAKANLATASKALADATDDESKVRAEIDVEVFKAIITSTTGSTSV